VRACSPSRVVTASRVFVIDDATGTILGVYPLPLHRRRLQTPQQAAGRGRLSRCYEGTEASARAWLEVVCVAYLFARLRTEPT
jgi:hypothetical protein